MIDLTTLEQQLPELRERYASASPFPHMVFDNFLRPDIAKRAEDEFPSLDAGSWINYIHTNERKYANTNPKSWGSTLETIWEALSSPRFVHFLSVLTGIESLLVDGTLEGGGLHRTERGGYLNVHADFTVHPHKQHWHRRCNLLVYLNGDWPSSYGGGLELWSRDMKTREALVEPIGNRAVVFTTGSDTWHGHPDPLRCPEGVARRSLAIYYYTNEEKPVARSTEYRARPGDGAKGILIYADKEAVRAYDWIKRRAGLRDEITSRWLRKGKRKRPPASS